MRGAGFGHAFGQYLGAYAKMYAITGDDGLLSKARALLHGWAECIEADGYGFNNPVGSVPDLHYEYEKLLGGLLDVAEHAGVPEALDHADRLTGWAERNLSRRVRRRSGRMRSQARLQPRQLPVGSGDGLSCHRRAALPADHGRRLR